MKKFLSLAFFLTLILSFSSCSKDDDEVAQPSYVGTWTATESMGSMELILSASNYESKFYLGPIPFGGAKGNLSVDGDIMTLTETELGVIDMETGVMTYYKAGSAEYVENEGDATPEKSKFSVDGIKLTMKSDDNNDKVYGGTGDEKSIVFTKK